MDEYIKCVFKYHEKLENQLEKNIEQILFENSIDKELINKSFTKYLS